jgi:hypothetical protein
MNFGGEKKGGSIERLEMAGKRSYVRLKSGVCVGYWGLKRGAGVVEQPAADKILSGSSSIISDYAFRRIQFPPQERE